MRVKLFNREYFVESVDASSGVWKEELGENYIGRTYENHEHIVLSRDVSVNQEKITLVHELIHCILYNTGHEHDELLIDALSCGFINLLLENPDLYKYIVGNNKI